MEPIEGQVTGEIPKWITGTLIQNGPGTHKIGKVTLNHLFDGMALLHRINILEGKVTYQCRFIESDAYEKIKKEQKIHYGEFGTSRNSQNLFQRLVQLIFYVFHFCNLNFS